MKKQLRIGFFANPYAGLGGPQALKGSDELAKNLSQQSASFESRSFQRAAQFFTALQEINDIEWVCERGAMGLAGLRNALPAQTFDTLKVSTIDQEFVLPTKADDSRALCRALSEAHIDLLLFVGGDGTARDVCVSVAKELPVLGIPAGVKMHSGVFAISPSAAAEVVRAMALGELVSVANEQVRDIDETAFQQGIVRSRHFGEMLVPQALQFVQSVKQGGVEVDELVLLDIAHEIEERIADAQDNTLFIFAPGSTTHFIQQHLQMDGTLLGIDVSDGHTLLDKDVSAERLQQMLEQHSGPVILILTAIGGQGHILGRGNQQLTPNILRRIGRENLWVVATKAKLLGLASRPLICDSNDAALDAAWQGLIPVITGFHDTVLYRVGQA